MRFRAVVQLGGKTATGIEVPAEVVEGLGGSKRPAVNVTINGYGYRSTVASMGGRYMLPISAEHRQGAGVAAGDEVEVALELDTAPREVTVPADLAAALDGAPEAKRFFDGLSYSRKLRYVLQVEGAKKAETRQRRVADTITRLANGEA
ncbi:MAG TPA: YdeI/OmpD-associated family protein [Nonomuraea sp.]|nr:YdeI/OmpD-associated family protein [Nonomuraea sp.]